MTIREYLSREARRITDGALAGLSSVEAVERSREARRARFLEMMGLDSSALFANRPVPYTVTGTIERPGYRIEKLYYESLPQLYVTANLYVPETASAERPAPGVVYFCGHSETQKVHYQAHARRFAQIGFACLIVETVQLGEVRAHHHGCYYQGWFHWYSRGYTPAGVELLNGVRGLDLLGQRPDVDAGRLGVTGISGGGATTWWVAAADDRVKVAAPVCGTSTLASQIADRTIDGHCDCMWSINTAGWDLADVGALIAPRPLLIGSADRDSIFTLAGIREVHDQLRRLYDTLGAPQNLWLVETPGPHSYHERSRTAIFSWFLQHLQGKMVSPEEVGDLDERPESLESAETLQVFLHGPLPEDRSLTIHDELIRPAAPPEIETGSELQAARERVVRALRETTFHGFPKDPLPLDRNVDFEFDDGGATGCRFSFTAEEGWRLPGILRVPYGVETPASVVVALRSPREERQATERRIARAGGRRAQVVIEPLGTGETAWGEDLQWHLRRAAAWTGRTIASMRVFDTLRALEAVRSLPEVQGQPVLLLAEGEMAAVALYAALLDGDVSALLLESPPATQDAPSQPDGRGQAIEMLGCLKHTDLPQVACLLYPARIVIAGDCPRSYDRAEALYRRLGAGDRFVRSDPAAWEAA